MGWLENNKEKWIWWSSNFYVCNQIYQTGVLPGHFTQNAWYLRRHGGQYAKWLFLFPIGWKLCLADFHHHSTNENVWRSVEKCGIRRCSTLFEFIPKQCHHYALKGLSHEIFRPVFLPVWIYLGLNGNRFSFLNFKEDSFILDSYFQYWCVSCQTFSEIRRISKKDWQLTWHFSNFLLFWVSGPPRNAAKGVNTSRRFVESLRMIDTLFHGSPRIFFNNISVSLIQSSIRLGDS